MTDNGKIYRSQQYEYICAGLGVTVLRHGVGLAHQKGKIERFFRTVRLRFISTLKKEDLLSIDTLNEKFGKWLHSDYQTRPHTGLNGETPLDFFLKQADKIRLITDLADFNRKLLITVKRTVKKDATISLNSNLYETDMFLAGEKLNVKYDPDGDLIKEIFLYRDDAPVGSARLVNFTDNSKRRRAGSAKAPEKAQAPKRKDADQNEKRKSNTISYSSAMGGEA
jgi:hypothetical protein